MRKRLMNVVVLGMAVLLIAACGAAVANNKKDKKEPEVVSESQQRLVKVSTLSSVEANQEFQRNVQIMQAQRQRVMQLQAQYEQAQTDELKKSLKKELDAAIEKLNKDNKTMTETYGFSLNRNYVQVIEKSDIYMAVTKEEAEKIEAEMKKKK